MAWLQSIQGSSAHHWQPIPCFPNTFDPVLTDGMSVSKLASKSSLGRKTRRRKGSTGETSIYGGQIREFRGACRSRKGKCKPPRVRSETRCDAAGVIAPHGGIYRSLAEARILWGYIIMRKVPIKCELCVLLYSCETRNRPFAGFPRAARFRAPRLQRGRFY